MSNNEGLLKLFAKAGINLTDEIKSGELLQLLFTKDNLITYCLKFPKVIDINTEKDIRSKLKELTIAMGLLDSKIILTYHDNIIPKDMLEIYYNCILRSYTEKKPTYALLETFKKEFNDNQIKFFVGGERDKSLIDPMLNKFHKVFDDYGLKVECVTEISPFEISTDTKIKEKQKQSNMEIKQQISQFDNLISTTNTETKPVRGIKKPRLKSPINGAAVSLADIPTSEVNLIEYSQQNGTKEFVVQGELVESNIKEIHSKKNDQNYKIFEGVLSENGHFVSIQSFINLKTPDEEIFYRNKVKAGYNAKVYGYCTYSTFSRDIILHIKEIIVLGKVEDKVNFAQTYVPRIELHAHTKMSTQDGLLDVNQYVSTAKARGYTALAVTDHNNIQIWPDFYNACKTNSIKPIFGLEGAFVSEDSFKIALTENEDIDLVDATYVVFDIETTGLSENYDEIIEIGAVKLKNGEVIGNFDELIKPSFKIDKGITDLTSISWDDVKDAPSITEVLPRFMDFVGEGCILIAHNAKFDTGFIYSKLKDQNIFEKKFPTIDTLQLARSIFKDKKRSYRLDQLAKLLNVELVQHHRGIYDAEATANIWVKMLDMLLKMNIHNYRDVNSIIDEEEVYKYAFPSHITILCQNKIGKKNMYKIVSDANTDHFHKVPRILKKYLASHREGLLIGSACVNGEIFDTAYRNSYDELLQKMKFYDYIEIQPISQYDVKIGRNAPDRMRPIFVKVVKRIVKAAKELGKIVVATGDVHYLTKADKQLREIYINSKRIGGLPHPLKECQCVPDYHFRTTEEIKDELLFLGDDLHSVVVDNPQKIADKIEEFELFPNKLFAPGDDFLADKGIPSIKAETIKLTYSQAKKIYGDPLPKYIQDRLDTEISSIVGHSFAQIYYIAYMLVKYSKEAGYVVGSRGSVGSSLVAYMMGITEVNSLTTHYYCPKCHFVAFKLTDEEKCQYPLDENQAKFDEVLQSVGTGYDLPSKKCPVCGEEMKQSGVGIPFATFLGFNGEKVPDIDLNFSGDFQPRAHEFCRTIFGVDRAFRAGTIGTIAEKTAIGHVKNYCERKGIQMRRAEMLNFAHKIMGVKRSTGQHPGGIVVIPKEIEYCDITPIQYPADDVTSPWRTTHFDYHKFESNLLKLDILGHDDPTMIRHLMNFVEAYPDEFEFSTVDDIPLTDKKVFGLFNGLESLGLTPSQTFGQTIGTTGIPEFGTTLTKKMLSQIRPNSVASLLKISGLSHGKGVWQGNSRDFMMGKKQGFATIDFNDLIGCRDDIMLYLIDKHLPSIDAFAIMEKVRHGRGLTPAMEKEMVEHDVPPWYIESCKMIQYMFPKAHATAYVIMALRIGWFKVHKPIYYYAAYFSRRADGYDVESMADGVEAIQAKLLELQEKLDNKTALPKDSDIFNALLLAIEMVSRGYRFVQIDINESAARDFLVTKDKKGLIIPFGALEGLGEAIGKTIVEARSQSPFTSKEDVRKRTKINNTQFEKMNSLGSFKDLPEKDQMGLF